VESSRRQPTVTEYVLNFTHKYAYGNNQKKKKEVLNSVYVFGAMLGA
jgi:hypothetical protein